MAYCKPYNAGLDSEPRAVGRRLGRLLDALDTEITVHVAEGALVEEVRNLKFSMLAKLREEGWRARFTDRDRWQVLPPWGGA